MVEARAADAHEQQIAGLQLLVLLQLAEARGLPAVIEIWRAWN
jgi:hypothetical protein